MRIGRWSFSMVWTMMTTTATTTTTIASPNNGLICELWHDKHLIKSQKSTCKCLLISRWRPSNSCCDMRYLYPYKREMYPMDRRMVNGSVKGIQEPPRPKETNEKRKTTPRNHIKFECVLFICDEQSHARNKAWNKTASDKKRKNGIKNWTLS